MNLKDFREAYNLTQAEFAKLIGVPRTTYQMWEHNWRKISNSNMIKLEKAIRKIESENANIEKIIDKMQAIKSYRKAQELVSEFRIDTQDYTTCKKWKYVLLLIILGLIFAVLY